WGDRTSSPRGARRAPPRSSSFLPLHHHLVSRVVRIDVPDIVPLAVDHVPMNVDLLVEPLQVEPRGVLAVAPLEILTEERQVGLAEIVNADRDQRRPGLGRLLLEIDDLALLVDLDGPVE